MSKTPVNRARELTGDGLVAAVEAYENSKEGRAARKPKPESRAAQLSKLFYQTPEMQECKITAGAILNKLDPGDTVEVKIKLPKQFAQLAKFLDKKSAVAGGAKPMPLAKLIRRTLENYFHEQLHFLVVQPVTFAYYRDLWNHFCDAHDAPEEKIPDPLLGEAKGVQEGPF